jgi:transposase
MDKGYDIERVYGECEDRGIHPIIPIRETPAVKRGAHKPPRCEHGEWRFAGADVKRGAAKWRCPTGECTPASTWIKADRLHPLIARETLRFRKLYKQRGAVEREFGRLKHEWALAPLRARGIDRVRLHADLTILAKQSCAHAKTRTCVVAAKTLPLRASGLSHWLLLERPAVVVSERTGVILMRLGRKEVVAVKPVC